MTIENEVAKGVHVRPVTTSGNFLNGWRWLRHKIKHIIGGVVNRHPYLWYAAWGLMPRINFLLPHEKNYYAFRHLARPGEGLFLDVGANNGLSARGFHRLLPRYRIFSIEANELHRRALEKLKRSQTGFDYMIAAAGAENSSVTLHMATYKRMRLHTGASLSVDYLKESTALAFPNWVSKGLNFVSYETPLVKLDDLSLSPDLIKIDAEGYDYEVLCGLRKTIHANRPSILVEFDGKIAEKLTQFCADVAYIMYLYDDLRDRFVRFIHLDGPIIEQSGASPINLFLIPTEKINDLPLARV